MLFTVVQPLAIVTDNKEVLGTFVGLVTLDCVNQPKRFTRAGNAINAEQFCLFQRLCSLSFSRLVSYKTMFVAANSQMPVEQFIWAQMTVGKQGYVGCNKMPAIKAGEQINKPLNYVIHEVGITSASANLCIIKFPYGSFASSVCSVVTTPTAQIKNYCEAIDSHSYNSGGHLTRTVIKGIRIGEETHALPPFVVDVVKEHGVAQVMIVNAHTREEEYLQGFISTALSLYAQTVNGEPNDKLDEIASTYKQSIDGYCLALHAQTGIYAIPLQSDAKFSFDLSQVLLA